MRIFKTKYFVKWSKKHDVKDKLLVNAIREISAGLIDADYGSFLYKKRIATKGRGKSGSVRTLLACRIADKAFFLYGFEKNERDNINEKEKTAYKLLAKAMLAFNEDDIAERLKERSLIEVNYEQND